MRIIYFAFCLLVSFFVMSTQAQAPPLVDGDCAEYTLVKAQRHTVSKDVELHIFQDRHFVWICYSYPDGSFATADLKLRNNMFPDGINLHVSAQLGEWPLDKPDLAPKNPESELWWNHKGWTANTVWINGMDRSGARASFRFKNAKARELQLSKQRFGRGEWKMSIEIRSIRGDDGKSYDTTFPSIGFYTLKAK